MVFIRNTQASKGSETFRSPQAGSTEKWSMAITTYNPVQVLHPNSPSDDQHLLCSLSAPIKPPCSLLWLCHFIETVHCSPLPLFQAVQHHQLSVGSEIKLTQKGWIGLPVNYPVQKTSFRQNCPDNSIKGAHQKQLYSFFKVYFLGSH